MSASPTLVCVLTVCCASTAWAGTITNVDTLATYGTIQAAIDAAGDGHTISVGAGTYDEVLSIQKPISLLGTGAGSTTLTWTGGSAEQLVFLGTNSLLTIDGSVKIDGFTFQGTSSLTGDKDLIKFRAAATAGNLITISNNVFDAAGVSNILGIEESQGAANFLIEDNQFTTSSYAMWFNSPHDGEILGNTVSGRGIGMGGSGGIGTDNPRDLLIKGNTLDGGPYGLVLANNIADIAFQCNTISSNTTAGILHWNYGPASWSGVTFHNNNIQGNAAGVMTFGAAGISTLPATVDGTNNYWGAADGPSGVGPGSGDSILVSNLTYSPFLTAPATCNAGVTAVPLPSAAWAGLVLLIGLGGAGALRRR